MLSDEIKLDWLYRLKRKTLFTLLALLTTTIVVTMFFIANTLEDSLLADSKEKTRELAATIDANLHQLMILRAPQSIQKTLEHLVTENGSIKRTFILNNQGEITYSSDKNDIGRVIDRETVNAAVLTDDGRTHRNVLLIYNEADCYECHDPANATNGTLVIDRSLDDTFALIDDIEVILIASGFICLFILVPLLSRLLSRGIDQYIMEIFSRNEELRLLYVMVERLSKTLDMVLLKEIVIEIFKDILDADEVDLFLAKGEQEYSASAWKRDTGKLERCSFDDDEDMASRLADWQDGKLTKTSISDDKVLLCMPIQRGPHRLALITARKKEGRFKEERLKLSNLIGGHVAVAFDNARLYYIAITDELTKSFTKRHFRSCIDQSFADYQDYGSRFALLMMDLDHFKRVNDTHGHVVGDSVLQKLGEILRQSIRENDLAFRYGGEEFAIILPDTGVRGARYVAERIRSATEAEVFEPGSIDLKLTISIGVATCPDAPSIRELIVAADNALYQAKERGRNQIVVSEQTFEVSTGEE